MLLDEHKRSLLDLTRMFVYLPFNSIFDFVVYEDKQTLDFFMQNIYRHMRNERVGYGPKVDMLLDKIKVVLGGNNV